VIPRSVYPKKASPLASTEQHPYLSFLAAEANDHDNALSPRTESTRVGRMIVRVSRS
jgi:hypothetical protein